MVLTGGVDNMSQSPHAVRGIRFGVPLGTTPQLEDTLWVGLTDTHCKMPMGTFQFNLDCSTSFLLITAVVNPPSVARLFSTHLKRIKADAISFLCIYQVCTKTAVEITTEG